MAKPPLNPVTDSDVAAFSRYMRKWQRVLGLNDWRVEPASTRTKAIGTAVNIGRRPRRAERSQSGMPAVQAKRDAKMARRGK